MYRNNDTNGNIMEVRYFHLTSFAFPVYDTFFKTCTGTHTTQSLIKSHIILHFFSGT